MIYALSSKQAHFFLKDTFLLTTALCAVAAAAEPELHLLNHVLFLFLFPPRSGFASPRRRTAL